MLHSLLRINYPADELEIRHWENILKGSDQDSNEILDLVDRYPMHLSDIDFVARKAEVEPCWTTRTVGSPLTRSTRPARRIRREKTMQVLFWAAGNGF